MVAAYDAKQQGTWDPVEARRKRRKKTALPPCQDTPERSQSTDALPSGCSLSADGNNANDNAGLKSANPEDTGPEAPDV
jgi:hypothetical protein